MSARTTRRRAVLTVVSRTVSALAVLALGGAVVAVGILSPPPAPVPVPPVEVAVAAPAAELVCPGPVRLPTEPTPGEDLLYDPAFDPQPVRSDAALGVLTLAPADGEEPARTTLRALGEPDDDRPVPVRLGASAGVLLLDELDGARVARAEPVGDLPALVGAAVRVSTAAGDLRGLAAASCRRPTTESWLVGGGTELGSSARLVLQNPGRTPATVRISLWGPTGPVELAGAPEYLVPAGTERAVLLEGVAAEQRRVVVRTTASGGQITAYLQDSRLRGLVPDGVDYVVAGQGPAVRQVVPGLSVRGGEGPDGAGPLLRLLAPGEEDATVRITLVGRDGAVELPGADEVDLDAGTVLDVPLTGLPDGEYTVVVEADQPVVAGAMLLRHGTAAETDDEAVDRAWAASAAGGSTAVLALPDGARGRLVVADLPAEVPEDRSGAVPEDRSGVVLEVVGDDGSVLESRTLDLAEDRTVALTLASLLPDDAPDGVGVAGVVLRTTDRGVVWAVVLDEPAAVALLGPVAPPPAQPTVGVRVR